MLAMKRIVATFILTLSFVSIANADVVWPALYAETKVSSIPIIALSLIIEGIIMKWLFNTSWKRASIYTVVANAVSGVLGLFLRPLSGIAWELSLGAIVNLLFHWGTFNPVAWFFVPVIGGAVNAAIELLTIKTFWKEKFSKKNLIVLWVANWVTVGMATIWVIIYPPQM